MILEIIKHPHEILRTKAKPIKKVDKKIKKLARNMKATLEVNDGVGLAAPQVGVSKRIIAVKTVRFVDGQMCFDSESRIMINPEIVSKSKEKLPSTEGCLSIEGIEKIINRHKNIVVDYTDIKGDSCQEILSGLDSFVVQHEIDHLNGVLIIDY